MTLLEKGKIVVTGGAGFIGSALIWALNRRGLNNILVVDFHSDDEKFKNLDLLQFDDYLEADQYIDKIHANSYLFKETQVIFHLGACSSTTERNVRYLFENNYEYTKRLAHWALNHDTRFIYASSASTYGDGSHGLIDHADQLDQLQPLNLYAYSKHLFDVYAHQQGLLDKIVGLKYFNVFGPNEYHKGDMRSVVNKTFHQIRESGIAKLFKSYHADYNDGEQKRDFLYVKDAANMTLHLAEKTEACGIFNIGSGTANTWIDLVSPLFPAMGLPRKTEFIDMPEPLRAKYQYFTQADISRLRYTAYDHPITDLSSAVTDYVENYLLQNKYLGSVA